MLDTNSPSLSSMQKLIIACAVALASGFAPPMSVRPQSAMRASVSMEEEKAAKKEKPPPKPRVPGEGDPFSEVAQAYGNANRDGGSAFQPRAISDATVIDCYQSYIEADDEPWHATCKSPGNILGIDTLTAAKPASVLEAEEKEEASGKKKVGGDKPGWTDKRALGKVHDNSVA